MPRLTPQRCWRLAHRWLGLTLGLVLLVTALSGSLLILAEPLDEALHAQLFHSRTLNAAGPLDPVVQKLRTEFGPDASFRLRPPREQGQSLQVGVDGPWQGTLYFDAATGEELGRRGAGEGFFNFLFMLHSSLFAGESGRALLTAAAFGYAAMLLSGVVLWWPSRKAWTVKLGAGLTRALFDLHRLGAMLLGTLALVAVVSGAYMTWRPLSAWVTALSGQMAVTPPVSPVSSDFEQDPADAAVAQARAQFPEGLVGYVLVPARGKGLLRIRVRLPDDPHPNGLSSVWLDPRTANVLSASRWSELDVGTRAYSFMYPLHIGSIGGAATLVATFVAGIALTGFAFSGAWLWWRRRGGSRQRTCRVLVSPRAQRGSNAPAAARADQKPGRSRSGR